MGSLDEKWLFGEFASSLLPGKKGVTATSAPIQALHIIWPSVDDVVRVTLGLVFLLLCARYLLLRGILTAGYVHTLT